MGFEEHRVIYENYTPGTRLDVGKPPATFNFSLDKRDGKSYRLLNVGETGLFYHWRSELDYPLRYRSIADSLNSTHTKDAQYSLDMSSDKPEHFLRKAYKKIMWPPRVGHFTLGINDEIWRFGINVEAKGLKIHDGGYLRACVEIHKKHDGVDPHAPYFVPESVINIDIPEGSYGWRSLYENIRIDTNTTAYVGVWLEGKMYSGEVYIEAPTLTGDRGTEALPPFSHSVPETDIYDWTGQNLTKAEWPEFRVRLNGDIIFEGEIFERCHRNSEWEIPLPSDKLVKDNTLSYELLSRMSSPLPYYLREITLVEQPNADVELISATKIAHAGGKAYLLIKTKQANTRVYFRANSDAIFAEESFLFEAKGLHGIAVNCRNPTEHAGFTLSGDGFEIAGEIARIVLKEDDGVITGTGDAIYIPHTRDMLEEFLSWYFSENLGNMITFRSTYRWTGARWLDEQLWKDIARLMNELGEKYVVMLDGRELSGQNCNPDPETMSGDGFLGWQSHERDGAIYYWDPRKTSTLFAEQYSDMAQRIYEEDPCHTDPQYLHTNFIYKNNTVYYYRDPDIAHDMKIGMLRAVGDHKTMRGNVPRHTGPSVMFKYFLASGYDWVGAETMYTTIEPQLAFLRGANLCYGKRSMGVHHAMQWSSEPLDAEGHYDRYRLALYSAYLQGATDINTEEGFWHLEGVHNSFTRFTLPCIEHKRRQQDFYDFVASHTRSGTFRTPMALIHGRYDGWHSFGNRMPWGWRDCKLTPAEKSWELLKVFYPLARPGEDIYIYNAGETEPLGYYSGTPRGNIDALPIESNTDVFLKYRSLAFVGYNAYDEADISRILKFVEHGGELLLTLAHLTTATDFTDIASGKLKYENVRFPALLGDVQLLETAVGGNTVPVAANCVEGTILQKTDDGLPLVIEYNYGSGKITFVTASAYPSDPAICEIYAELLKANMERATAPERAWASCGDYVEFAIYKQPDGTSHVYFLAIDWYREHSSMRHATLRAENEYYNVDIPFGTMIKAVTNGSSAAWSLSEAGEVLSVSKNSVTLQGSGKIDFMLCKNGAAEKITADFSNSTVQTIIF